MNDAPHAVLKPEREKSLHRRHPWIFSGAIERIEEQPAPGTTVRVVSSAGEFLAWAAVSPASQIRLRVWSFDAGAAIDEAFFRERIDAAIALRRRLGFMDANGACRLVHSESDGLPGLIVDRYRDYYVCQFLSAGADYWRDVIVAALLASCDPRGIYERSDAAVRSKEGLASRRAWLQGKPPDAAVEFAEQGVRLLAEIGGGQKTGAYLDQSVNRRRVAAYAEGASVLDAYSYGGGFSLAALLNGAAEATLIDSSAEALNLARRQAGLNGVAERCRFVDGNVPAELRRLRDEERRFDLIVLDPPKFVHNRSQIPSGSRGYKDINHVAMQLLRPAGILATFSCSGHVSPDLFQKIVAGAALDAGRDFKVLERLSQSPDHPVAVSFPEAEYLKGLVLCAVD